MQFMLPVRDRRMFQTGFAFLCVGSRSCGQLSRKTAGIEHTWMGIGSIEAEAGNIRTRSRAPEMKETSCLPR